jgi:hypothetical protein
MNADHKRLKAAFDAQNNENRQIVNAFNTIRALFISTIRKYEPDTETILLSAANVNAVSDRLKFLGISVTNPPGSEDVIVKVSDNEVEMTMRVAEGVKGELTPDVEDAPLVLAKTVEFPRFCRCSHTNSRHIGGVGVCRENDCDCLEFNEKKYV